MVEDVGEDKEGEGIACEQNVLHTHMKLSKKFIKKLKISSGSGKHLNKMRIFKISKELNKF